MNAALVVLGIIVALVAVFAFLAHVAKRQMNALRARAEAGDPGAREELARMEGMRRALERSQGKPDPERDRIAGSGIPGRGKVLGVRRLGFRIKRGAQQLQSVELDLECEAEGQPAQSFTAHELIDEALIGRLLIGASVPLRVDPSPPHRVVVLWDHA